MTNNISKAEQILFEEYYTKVFKSVYIYCNDYHFAEDATQEAFLRAFENIDKLRDVNSFAGWVYVIAINIVKKEFKKTKKITQINFIDCENKFTSKDEYSNIELKEVLADLLTQVSLDESKALTLFYIMDLPLKEIAQLTGSTISAIKVKLHRTRQKLKQQLEKNPSDISDLLEELK